MLLLWIERGVYEIILRELHIFLVISDKLLGDIRVALWWCFGFGLLFFRRLFCCWFLLGWCLLLRFWRFLSSSLEHLARRRVCSSYGERRRRTTEHGLDSRKNTLPVRSRHGLVRFSDCTVEDFLGVLEASLIVEDRLREYSGKHWFRLVLSYLHEFFLRKLDHHEVYVFDILLRCLDIPELCKFEVHERDTFARSSLAVYVLLVIVKTLSLRGFDTFESWHII